MVAYLPFTSASIVYFNFLDIYFALWHIFSLLVGVKDLCASISVNYYFLKWLYMRFAPAQWKAMYCDDFKSCHVFEKYGMMQSFHGFHPIWFEWIFLNIFVLYCWILLFTKPLAYVNVYCFLTNEMTRATWSLIGVLVFSLCFVQMPSFVFVSSLGISSL